MTNNVWIFQQEQIAYFFSDLGVMDLEKYKRGERLYSDKARVKASFMYVCEHYLQG